MVFRTLWFCTVLLLEFRTLLEGGWGGGSPVNPFEGQSPHAHNELELELKLLPSYQYNVILSCTRGVSNTFFVHTWSAILLADLSNPPGLIRCHQSKINQLSYTTSSPPAVHWLLTPIYLHIKQWVQESKKHVYISSNTNIYKLGLSWAKLSRAGVKPGVGLNQLL